ncbi:hypothetical protein TeGR_g3983, partial [Tetraparma gracilis]
MATPATPIPFHPDVLPPPIQSSSLHAQCSFTFPVRSLSDSSPACCGQCGAPAPPGLSLAVGDLNEEHFYYHLDSLRLSLPPLPPVPDVAAAPPPPPRPAWLAERAVATLESVRLRSPALARSTRVVRPGEMFNHPLLLSLCSPNYPSPPCKPCKCGAPFSPVRNRSLHEAARAGLLLPGDVVSCARLTAKGSSGPSTADRALTSMKDLGKVLSDPANYPMAWTEIEIVELLDSSDDEADAAVPPPTTPLPSGAAPNPALNPPGTVTSPHFSSPFPLSRLPPPDRVAFSLQNQMVAVPLLLGNPSQKYVVRVFGQVVSNTGAYRDGRYVASELVLNLGWGTMHAHVAGAGGVNVPTSWGPQHVRADVETVTKNMPNKGVYCELGGGGGRKLKKTLTKVDVTRIVGREMYLND